MNRYRIHTNKKEVIDVMDIHLMQAKEYIKGKKLKTIKVEKEVKDKNYANNVSYVEIDKREIL